MIVLLGLILNLFKLNIFYRVMGSKIQGKEAVENYYQDNCVALKYLEERYSSLFGRLKNELEIKGINSFLKIVKPIRLLDIAMGTGRVTRSLKNFGKGYGIDTSNEMLSHARKILSKWKLKRANAFHMSFNEGFFDVILSTRFIWHFDKNNRKKLFNEIYNKLNREGHLIFDFPNANIMRFVPHKSGIGKRRIYTHSWTPQGVKKELKVNRFDLISIKPILRNPKKLYLVSSTWNPWLGNMAMRIINWWSNKEPYSYLALARKLP